MARAASAAGQRRAEGSIETLPSGALRVVVYAGIDPVTHRRHYLREVVPAGPNAEREAEAVRARLVAEVAERRNPRTGASIDQLLERYLDQFDGSPNTLTLYRGYVRNHISPLIGKVKVGALDAEVLDAFYAELRRCRKHCTKRRDAIDHRTAAERECDERCRPHRCRPLGPTTFRHMHFILSGAYRKGGPLALGRRLPGHAGRAAGGAEGEPEPADAGRGRADPDRGLPRSRLGHVAVGRDDHRRPPR